MEYGGVRVSLSQNLSAMFCDVEPVSEEQRRIWQAEANQEFMLEPSVVTKCHTCGHIAYMPRMGCCNRMCPDQPFAMSVSHYYENFQGQLLTPGKDWIPLEQRPLTEWT